MQPVPGYGTPFPQGHAGALRLFSRLAPTLPQHSASQATDTVSGGEADRMKQAGVRTWSIGHDVQIAAFVSCDFFRRHAQGGQVALFSMREWIGFLLFELRCLSPGSLLGLVKGQDKRECLPESQVRSRSQ